MLLTQIVSHMKELPLGEWGGVDWLRRILGSQDLNFHALNRYVPFAFQGPYKTVRWVQRGKSYREKFLSLLRGALRFAGAYRPFTNDGSMGFC